MNVVKLSQIDPKMMLDQRNEARVDAVLHDNAAHVLHRDYETRSEVRLGSVGAFQYAADPATEVLCCAYAVDDSPAQLWTPGDPVPAAFLEAAANPNWIVVAHNDQFETAIERHLLHPRYNWPLIPIEQHRCTMALSLACGLPARLSAAADALELSNRKDKAGEKADASDKQTAAPTQG
jgi:DNA polymerase